MKENARWCRRETGFWERKIANQSKGWERSDEAQREYKAHRKREVSATALRVRSKEE
ncbi:hypothetical protein BDV98DRAFT_562063 [Pterulicium gracile]|uniref:Uncharacterized protein n=1 Tax=Pterulicium gracile TaxID=1884261 RepID=A0A5C3QV07_9AGAR|nr:hypothetical protein BDV98DRAFT_562063 [Pterula gracilis]